MATRKSFLKPKPLTIDSAKHSDPVAIAIDGMRLGTDFIVAAEEDSSDLGLRIVPDEAKKN